MRFGSGVRRCDEICAHRYTRMVGNVIQRGVSIILLVLLSGTPALASVCAALCLPSGSHDHLGGASGASVPTPEKAAAEAGHHHEAPPQAVHHHSDSAPTAAPGSLIGSQYVSVPHECCSDTARTAMLSAPARTEIGTLLLATAPVPAPELYARVSAPLLTAFYGKALSPPAPVRSPLVLRV